jgi:CO/xanthine dehydrogenase Mo-binding subunit
MLRAAAAKRWGVPVTECVARDGTIVHRDRAATYGDLAGEAAAQSAPKHVRLKEPKDFTWIGKSLDRLDARPKVDGSGIYGIDVKVPGMVTAVLIRAPVRGATIRTFDAGAARSRRGVVDIVRVGDAIAVAAVGYWEARTAAELVTVEWEGGAAVDSDTLFASYAKLTERPGDKTVRDDGSIEPHRPSAVLLAGSESRLANGPTSIEAMYALPYLSHATMEPQNATAWLHDGKCDVWAPTQTPGVARWRVAESIGYDLADVAIHTTMLGGGFGRRGLVDYAVEAARAAQALGRPTKVVWSREDDQDNDWYRPMAVSRLRGAVAGTAITTWHHRLVCQSIIASEGGDFVGALLPNAAPRPLRSRLATSVPRLMARGTIVDSTSVEGAIDLPYEIPNLRVEFTPVETGVPVGFWRSVGHSHNAFVTECFFDELCHAAKLDPFEARRALLANHPRHRGVLELAAAKAGWGTPLPAGVGRGIAVHFSFGSYCAQVIEASLDGTRVKLHRVVVAIDCGRVVNPGLVAAQAESAVVFGLSAALKQRVTFRAGRVQERNFHTYKPLRMFECPPIETHLVTSTERPTGVGEPGVPPVAPALCNALFTATGRRIRRLPIEEELRA